jgi:hypothetical protein
MSKTNKPKNLENLQLELKDSLESLKCLEVVVVSSRKGDIRFLCRCFDEPRWLQVMSLFMQNEKDWYSFMGKKYFMDKGKLRFGWVVMFESDDLPASVMQIRKLLSEVAEELKIAPPSESGEDTATVKLPWTNDYYTKAADRRVKSVS